MRRITIQLESSENYPTNEHGVVQYPKGDIRRWFVLLAAIDYLERPTITSLSEYTGWNKGSIQRDMSKIEEQLQVVVDKNDSIFEIKDWGNLINPEGLKMCLTGCIMQPTIS